tara:strand:+ start:2878 stop:3195 length:318 start_codon:yes stop_codon:yes gene_type:complete
MKKINLYLIVTLIFLTSCQSIKDGLSGNKSENSDEFLVKKKSPLVMPPKFMELPKPGDQISDNEVTELEKSTDIKNILDLEKLSKSKPKKSGSAEDFVLKKIQNK